MRPTANPTASAPSRSASWHGSTTTRLLATHTAFVVLASKSSLAVPANTNLCGQEPKPGATQAPIRPDQMVRVAVNFAASSFHSIQLGLLISAAVLGPLLI